MSTTWRNYIRSLLLLSNVICYNRLDLVHATATWLTRAADIHSEYVTRITSPRQQWLRERASITFIRALSLLFVLCRIRFEIHVFCTMHCVTNIQHTPTKCALFK